MKLDPRLENDSFYVADLDLCQVRLHKNSAFPWVLLIPKQNNLSEIFDLSPQDQQQLMREIDRTARIVKTLFNADKINIATLGNVVSQLHVHVVARYQNDPLWPDPIWGRDVRAEYQAEALEKVVIDIKHALETSYSL